MGFLLAMQIISKRKCQAYGFGHSEARLGWVAGQCESPSLWAKAPGIYYSRHLSGSPAEAWSLAGKACRLDETIPFSQRNNAASINWAKSWVYSHYPRILADHAVLWQTRMRINLSCTQGFVHSSRLKSCLKFFHLGIRSFTYDWPAKSWCAIELEPFFTKIYFFPIYFYS